MSKISRILKLLMDKLSGHKQEVKAETTPTPVEIRTEPKREKIENEPILAIKDGYLVMVVQHQFNNLPSWIEWDKEREIATIAHMNGDIHEAPLALKSEHLSALTEINKVLIVSNDNGKKIMHYVQFISR